MTKAEMMLEMLLKEGLKDIQRTDPEVFSLRANEDGIKFIMDDGSYILIEVPVKTGF